MTSREVWNLWAISGRYVGWQGGGVAVAMRHDETMRCRQAVCEPWGCQPLPPPFPLRGRLGSMVRSMMAVAGLPRCHTERWRTREERDGKNEVYAETC
jgi:hypothetical protein